MKQILFVCTGNTCRSPMAEAIFNDLVSKNPKLSGKFEADSCGVSANENAPMSANARQALLNMGIKPEAHKAKQANEALIMRADLVLTMQGMHAMLLSLMFPGSAKEKAHALKAYAVGGSSSGAEFDVQDPYGGTIADYERAAKEIREAIEKVIIHLEEEK